MKATITLSICILLAARALANINFIDITKISNESRYVAAFGFVKDNQDYYSNWTNEWHFDKPKGELITSLRKNYTLFSSINPKNEEIFLLLGDIAHYLYNLDDTAYFSVAVTNYKQAIKSNPGDCRAHWFLGYHYSVSNVPEEGIKNLLKAETLLPAQQPATFWGDYAFATAIANMPSHSIFAMDNEKKISGKAGFIESQIGPSIHKRIAPVNTDSFYKKEDIWTATRGEKSTFTCRPMGLKATVDSSWGVTINDYDKHQLVFIANPPEAANKKGKKIGYTILVLMRVAGNNEKLEDFISNLAAGHSEKKRISFSDKYDKMFVYEIKDKTMYEDIGGGHMYIAGVERSAPKYPGLLLESPAVLPASGGDQVAYYRAAESKDRFKGRIFYAILLDSCEDIHEESLAVFTKFFNDQLIIE